MLLLLSDESRREAVGQSGGISAETTTSTHSPAVRTGAWSISPATPLGDPDRLGHQVDEVEPGENDAQAFVTGRVRFAPGDHDEETHDQVGTVESIRRGADEIVEAITSPDEGECPQCGLALSEGGPPMCPRCGAPY